jgi:retinol dehydrogenase-14
VSFAASTAVNVMSAYELGHMALEHIFALNHLAPFLLTNLLLDRLKASAPARVVTVSSGAQAAGRIDFDDLQGARSYSGQRAYSQSKLGNILFTNELARRLQDTGVTANSVHPGVVRTNFGSEDQAGFFRIISPVVRPFLKTPTQGAWTPIYLASSPDLEGITSQFFANRKPKTANQAAGDVDVTARLWRVSIDLVGLTGSPR